MPLNIEYLVWLFWKMEEMGALLENLRSYGRRRKTAETQQALENVRLALAVALHGQCRDLNRYLSQEYII